MSETTITRSACEARAKNIIGNPEVDLRLDLREAPTSPTFDVDSTWRIRLNSPTLFFDYLGDITDISVNAKDVPFSANAGGVELTNLPTEEEISIRIRGKSSYSRTGQGLHRFIDPSDGHTYLYSHCEPSDARRIHPVLEQPDIKYCIQTTLVVPEGWHALANGNPLSDGTATTFSRSEPLSSYLTAFAAGPYVGLNDTWHDPRSGRDIELGAWCRKSMRPYFDPENILAMTKAGLTWFCDLFDSAYPWARYDSIFVPEYNLGAMENPGLVTFTENYIFRDTPTESIRAARANTLLHEMSHMWFGDLVTPQWWDDLWLKESFAEYMGAAASVGCTEHQDAWVNFAGHRMNWALEQDQLPTTHPIAADIPDVEAASQNFDGITYAKGAAVLRQLVHYVGEEDFIRASRSYFHKHAFNTATFSDLIAELEEAHGAPLDHWVDAWLRTSGFDIARISVAGPDILITLENPAPHRPHRLDIGLYALNNGVLTRTKLLDVHLDAPITRVHTELAPEELAQQLIVLNDQAHSYIVGRFNEPCLELIEAHLSTINDPLTRAIIWQQLGQMVDNQELDPALYLRIVGKHLVKESNATTANAVLNKALGCVLNYCAGQRQEHLGRELVRGLRRELASAKKGSDMYTLAARFLIPAELGYASPVGGHDREEAISSLRQLREQSSDLGPTHRWNINAALRALNAMGEEELAQELELDNTLTGQAQHLRAELSLPELGAKQKILQEVTTPGAYSNNEVAALLDAWDIPGCMHGALRADTLSIQDFLNQVESWWAQHPLEVARQLVVRLFPTPKISTVAINTSSVDDHPEDEVSEVCAATRNFLAERKELPRGLRRLLKENLFRARRMVCIQQQWSDPNPAE